VTSTLTKGRAGGFPAPGGAVSNPPQQHSSSNNPALQIQYAEHISSLSRRPMSKLPSV